MGRKSATTSLYCSMNGFLVGELKLKQGRLSFKYHPDWLALDGSRAISLSIPLQISEISSDAVFNYFDNLLPDNDLIRQQIVDRLGANSIKPFDLLAQIGGDCVGAMAMAPEQPLNPMQPISVTPQTEAEIAQQIRNSRTNNTLGMDSNEDFRISLAGAQEKTAFTFWQEQWCKPHGGTATTHIFKPPILHHESIGQNLSSSVDNEWFCLTLLKHLGIAAASVDIQQFEDQKVLVVERFDRKVTENQIIRLPQEDMCQALERASGSKYEEHGGPGALAIMDLLKLSKNSIADRLNFFKNLVAFWLLAAIDGHAKNFSIFLQQDGFCLTPLYDVISASPYFGQGKLQKQKIKMAMKVHSKNSHYHWHKIQRRHWFSHGKYLGLSENQVEEILTDLTTKLGTALDKTLAEATELFDQEIGFKITEVAKTSSRRLA